MTENCPQSVHKFVSFPLKSRILQLYNYFINECRKYIKTVETGIFGADMQVELLNDGPFTVILE